MIIKVDLLIKNELVFVHERHVGLEIQMNKKNFD
jgi:hypothetical protein